MITSSLLATLISTMTPLELAIWMVETNQCTEDCPKGNAGEIGPLQITSAAWIDVSKKGEKFEQCEDLWYSVITFRRYMDLYADPILTGKIFTNEIGARIWNGGPRGYLKDSTKKYWKKVNRVLRSQLPQQGTR